MGPRLQERGVLSRDIPTSLAIGLLQWGRAYKSAELMPIKCIAIPGFDASMGPRLQERGVSSHATSRFKSGLASMGPRLQERGVRLCARCNRVTNQRFNGAALTRARSFGDPAQQLAPRRALQWGRAYKSAEFVEKERILVTARSASMGPRLQERGVKVSLRSSRCR